MGPRDQLNPWDAPDPATIRTSVRRSIRLEDAAQAALGQRRPQVRAISPQPIPPSETIVPEDAIEAEGRAEERPGRAARRTTERPLQPALQPARPSLARPALTEATVILEESDAFDAPDGMDSEDSEPSIEDLDAERPRPTRLGAAALLGMLVGVTIVAIVTGLVAALAVGVGHLGWSRLPDRSIAETLPPIAAPIEIEEQVPSVTAPTRPAPRARPRPVASPAASEPSSAEVSPPIAPVELPTEGTEAEPALAEPVPTEPAPDAEVAPVEADSPGESTARPPPPTATLRPREASDAAEEAAPVEGIENDAIE